MPVKLRLQRKGRTKRPFYFIVVADSRSPRDGKYIERVGSYDATTKPATIEINGEKALDWLTKGAQPTETVRAILSYKGVLYKKHLLRGLKKGALTQEQVDAKFEQYVGAKDTAVTSRIESINQQLVDEKKKREAAEAKKREAKNAAAAAALSASEATEEEATNEDAPAAEAEVSEAAADEAPAAE